MRRSSAGLLVVLVSLALLLDTAAGFEILRLKKLAKLAIIGRALAPQIVPIPVPYGGHPGHYHPPPPPPPPPPQHHYPQHYPHPYPHHYPALQSHPVPVPVPIPVPVHHHHHIISHAGHVGADAGW